MAEKDTRKSGKTAAEEVAKEVTDTKNMVPHEPRAIDKETRRYDSPLFRRIKTEWNTDEKLIIDRVHNVIEQRIMDQFNDAFSIMYELYDLVRERVLDKDGNDKLDNLGIPIWKTSSVGNYIEDWSKLNHRQRERFLFQITTRLFEWEQRSTSAWAEAMFARTNWEESFATGFESLPKESATRPTVDDRTQRARKDSAEDQRFALVMTYYSKRAESIVKTMNNLMMRLKDVHTT